jgi:hypothetical protein
MVKNFFGHNGGVLEPLEPPPGYATGSVICMAEAENDQVTLFVRRIILTAELIESDH